MYQRQRQQDPIALQSDKVCEWLNSQPNLILKFARYFGEHPSAISAKMVEVDQQGLLLTCTVRTRIEPEEEGSKPTFKNEEHEVRVAFNRPLQTLGQVRETIIALAKEAERGLKDSEPESSDESAEGDKTFYLPDFDPILVLLAIFVVVMIYLDIFPNTKSPLLQWILQKVGPKTVHYIVMITLNVHVCEAIGALYLTVVVGQGFFKPIDVLLWVTTVFIFGIASMKELLPLAYRHANDGRQ
ncbi:hypothetical protein BGW41_002804 [Actinomortierella wolfii]|nr:hypothetical protein BGW41_002804 [Actinomortierella wolfii]